MKRGRSVPPDGSDPAPPASGLVAEDLGLHGVVALGLRIAVLAARERVLLLGREHEALAADEREEHDADDEDDQERDHGGLEHAVEEDAEEGAERQDERDHRAPDAGRRPVGALGVGEAPAQHDERDHLHHVRDDGAEHGDEEDDAARRTRGILVDRRDDDEHEHQDQIADDPADEQRDPRRLVLPAGERQELRVVAGARERVHVASVGEHDALQRGEQADQGEQREDRGEALGEEHPEAREQRLVAVAGRHRDRGRAGDRRVEEEHQQAGQGERDDAPDARLRDVLRRGGGLLGGERELLDAEEEPDRERKGEQDADGAEREELGVALGRGDVEQLREVDRARCERGDREEQQDADRDDGDDEGEAEADRRSERVQPDEGDVEDDPPHPWRQRDPGQAPRAQSRRRRPRTRR